MRYVVEQEKLFRQKKKYEGQLDPALALSIGGSDQKIKKSLRLESLSAAASGLAPPHGAPASPPHFKRPYALQTLASREEIEIRKA